MKAPTNECSETQLGTIRDLMLSAARRGAWLTLAEIAALTEFGEASISAQLRHLRKLRHGRHRVEKRWRLESGLPEEAARHAGNIFRAWEYRVLPPGWCERPVGPELQITSGGENAAAGLRASSPTAVAEEDSDAKARA
jgi:hypothetical protein